MKLLNLRLNSLTLTVLTPLFVACNSAPENSANQYQLNPKQEAVKNYTAINCSTSSTSRNVERNIASLASGYYMFKGLTFQPDYTIVKLSGSYATGQAEIDSIAFLPTVRDRLNINEENSASVKITSLVKMPTKVEKEQAFEFSHVCQIRNALLENDQLNSQPSGVLYLISSKKSFIVTTEGSYKPEPTMSVKFKLLNPRTQQTEEATIPLEQIIGGDYYSAPSSASEGIVDKIQNLIKGKEDNNTPQWSINKQVKVPHSPNHPYFTVTKQGEGEVIEGEILSVEFAPEEMK